MNVMLCYQQSRNILLFHGHDTKSRYVYLHHFFLNEHMDDHIAHSHMLVTCVQRADDSFMNEHMDDHMLIRTCSLHACSVQTTHS